MPFVSCFPPILQVPEKSSGFLATCHHVLKMLFCVITVCKVHTNREALVLRALQRWGFCSLWETLTDSLQGLTPSFSFVSRCQLFIHPSPHPMQSGSLRSGLRRSPTPPSQSSTFSIASMSTGSGRSPRQIRSRISVSLIPCSRNMQGQEISLVYFRQKLYLKLWCPSMISR